MIKDVINSKIRLANCSDAEEICLIHRDAIENLCSLHYSPEQISSWSKGCVPAIYEEAILKNHVLVAIDAHRIAGFIEYSSGEIVKLFVRGNAAHRGIGAALMRTVLAIAKEDGEPKLRVESTRNAQSFYERHGFCKTGEGAFSRGGGGEIEIVKLVADLSINTKEAGS